jgi:feruloyl esterase
VSHFTRKDAEKAIRQNPSDVESFDGDLSKFQQKGGKILHYHGQADYIITSANSNRYYDHVSQTMGVPSSDLDNFYRFFRISGMGHCTGGNGAVNIGNLGSSISTLDPQNNVLLRMVAWIEQGASQAPESVTGTAYVNVSFVPSWDDVRVYLRERERKT